jgi:pantothenate kinase
VSEAAALAATILERAAASARFHVANAGPPRAGKSTLYEAQLAAREAAAPGRAALVPMDGFHYDDAVLEARGLLARKGAPETFDVDGFAAMLARIRAGGREVAVPVFDRNLELSRAGARIVGPEAGIVVVEGNYLLLDEAPWRDLAGSFDFTVFLDVPEAELRRRLVERWLGYGFDPAAARLKAEGNDLANAARVLRARRTPDLVWSE